MKPPSGTPEAVVGGLDDYMKTVKDKTLLRHYATRPVNKEHFGTVCLNCDTVLERGQERCPRCSRDTGR